MADPPQAISWAALGARLRACGLTPQAMVYRLGSARLPSGPARSPTEPVATPPAGLLVHLFAAGDAVARAPLARLLGDALAPLERAGLIERAGSALRARVAIWPVGEALVVSDRADARRGRDLVAPADDSAFHMLGMLPERAPRPGLRWLDVGTGSAILPLLRPGAADHVVATDLHPRALTLARWGAALSGRRLRLLDADLFGAPDLVGAWDRITFNAPIPPGAVAHPPDTPRYRAGAADLIERFWAQVAGRVAPGGEVLVHSWQSPALAAHMRALPGRLVRLRYTPPEERPAFGITLWQPDAAPERRLRYVPLTPRAPHLRRALLDEA